LKSSPLEPGKEKFKRPTKNGMDQHFYQQIIAAVKLVHAPQTPSDERYRATQVPLPI
jgi:hypothetical protein